MDRALPPHARASSTSPGSTTSAASSPTGRSRAGATSPLDGRWHRGPGAALFEAVERELGHLPLIAEDLGIITPAVDRLRSELGLLGMRIVGRGFVAAAPAPARGRRAVRGRRRLHRHARPSDDRRVARDRLCRQISPRPAPTSPRPGSRTTTRCGRSSGSRSPRGRGIAILPMQDVLGLGAEARMNHPGTVGNGNWRWRLEPGQTSPAARRAAAQGDRREPAARARCAARARRRRAAVSARLRRHPVGRAALPRGRVAEGQAQARLSAKAQLQNRFGASVAEVDHHDLWQRSRAGDGVRRARGRRAARAPGRRGALAPRPGLGGRRRRRGGSCRSRTERYRDAMSDRMRRVNESVRQVLSEALPELKDPGSGSSRSPASRPRPTSGTRGSSSACSARRRSGEATLDGARRRARRAPGAPRARAANEADPAAGVRIRSIGGGGGPYEQADRRARRRRAMTSELTAVADAIRAERPLPPRHPREPGRRRARVDPGDEARPRRARQGQRDVRRRRDGAPARVRVHAARRSRARRCPSDAAERVILALDSATAPRTRLAAGAARTRRRW